jgi:Pyruvate phosphate dikinase, AMP/ATP-binding domain
VKVDLYQGDTFIKFFSCVLTNVMKYLSAMLPSPFLAVMFILASAVLPLYQASGQLVPPGTPAGKTSIAYEDEPFVNYTSGDGGAGFVKFSIILTQPGTVYFQDSNLFPFHYNFASQHLEPFLGMTATQFDAVSLRRSGQQVVLGAVIIPPTGEREYGIQFVGYDPYPKEDVKAWIDAVKASVIANPDATAVYIPSFEQKARAELDREWFASQGIEVDGIERWIQSDSIYSHGWAFGRLVFVPGGEIGEAYAAGVLKPADVLLTDGVPAEVPFVAGILSLSAATPNSHVAILARNQRVPFAWISRESEQQRVQALVGREVLVRASVTNGLRVSAADEGLSSQVRAQILKLKQPPPVSIRARKPFGALSADPTSLTPRDIMFFGGKAANFGLLRRTIPDRSPKAIAFSFDLWSQFMSNVNPDSGLTLREEIEQRLGGFTYPPDIAAASAALDEVRDLIRKKVKFTDTQKSAILDALTGAGFQSTRMLRFRSSSNVEDTEQISGAGLFESFNGCIADSLDGNDTGPCGCAPEEPNEKTVLSAIEKVYASFYNDNAWLERLRFGIRESTVGMAVLVHENAPDADEMANGVVTITRRRDSQSVEFELKIVSQYGAISVTNPEGGAKPEIVLGGQSGAQGEPYVYTQQHSDLVPLGANVMTWEADYRELTALLVQVAEGYARLFPTKKTFTLDLEFKKLQPGQLQVKQVRELVQPARKLVTPILLNEPIEFVVYQSEFGDAFAFHRLKCFLATETRNLRLTPNALSASVHRDATFDFLRGDTLAEMANGPRGFPGYRFARKGAGVHNERWKAELVRRSTVFRLRTTFPTRADLEIGPVVTQRDCAHTLIALYRSPQPYLDFEDVKSRTSDAVTLIPRDSLIPDPTVQTRRIQTLGGVVIDPRFFWPDYRDAPNTIIKTFPLAAWENTTITGLTSQPLVLTSEFAQTYAPGHHNFIEVFLYEPALDPTVNAEQKTELQNANIRLIHVYHDRLLGGSDVVRVLGFDGQVRTLP